MRTRTRIRRRRLPPAGFAAAVVLALVAGQAVAAGPAATPAVAASDRLLVSLGDSYGAGYQPGGRTTTDGFAYRLAADASLRLVNFACSGMTTAAMRQAPDCTPAALGPGGTGYGGRTQLGAATAYLAAHRDQVDLVTVVAGGNDVRDCLMAPDSTALRTDVDGAVLPCLRARMPALENDLTAILTAVRATVGPGTRIVGIGYPVITLGGWTSGDPAQRAAAARTVGFFAEWFDPLLRRAAAAAGAEFADVAAATGGFTPLTDTVDDPTWGHVPTAVARLCALTWVCRAGDVHPTPDGHQLIADLVRTRTGGTP